MEFEQAVRERRSIRAFRDESIPESVIEGLLDLGRHAPSSMDGQPWHFLVVRDPDRKRELAEIKNRYCPPEKRSYRADFLREAPVILLVCVDKQRSYDRDVENGVLAAAILMLAAHARGLGAVYLSAYAGKTPGLAKEIRDLFRIPDPIEPIVVLPLGLPADPPANKELRPLADMVHFERF